MLVVLGLVGLAVWRYSAMAPGGSGGQFSSEEMKQMAGSAEKPDSSGITTVKEYNYVPSAKLPEVKGISSYKPMADRTVRFAINVWAGWGPIILANDGFKPGKVWKTPGGKEFKVELVLIDDPVAMRDAYAAGNVHIGWATLDMVPLFMEGLRKDSRVMPRIYQQVDWSNGGDGIVVREDVKTISDLRGKKVVLAQNSPSHYFVLNMLVTGGVQPAEVEFKFTQDAFQAAAAFNADKTRRRLRQLGAGHLQPREGQGQPHAGDHGDGQQADRRRVVRAGRFRQGQPGHHRRARPRHLRRDGGAEEAGRTSRRSRS